MYRGQMKCVSLIIRYSPHDLFQFPRCIIRPFFIPCIDHLSSFGQTQRGLSFVYPRFSLIVLSSVALFAANQRVGGRMKQKGFERRDSIICRESKKPQYQRSICISKKKTAKTEAPGHMKIQNKIPLNPKLATEDEKL